MLRSTLSKVAWVGRARALVFGLVIMVAAALGTSLLVLGAIASRGGGLTPFFPPPH